jgi:Holliday junction resolvasome RuvABC endonuclease subunit
MKAPYRALTLAIHPSSHGFGWIAFENPFTIHSHGAVGARGAGKNEICLKRVERLFAKLTPETLVLEAFERGQSSRATRIAKLGRSIVALAVTEGINVAVYQLGEVRATFAHLGARTRDEIAASVVRLFPQLKRFLPPKRRAWESERWHFSRFCAAALVLTHYQMDAGKLLASLSL